MLTAIKAVQLRSVRIPIKWLKLTERLLTLQGFNHGWRI